MVTIALIIFPVLDILLILYLMSKSPIQKDEPEISRAKEEDINALINSAFNAVEEETEGFSNS